MGGFIGRLAWIGSRRPGATVRASQGVPIGWVVLILFLGNLIQARKARVASWTTGAGDDRFLGSDVTELAGAAADCLKRELI